MALLLVAMLSPAYAGDGDVNGDGVVDFGDAALALRFYGGFDAPTPTQVVAGEVTSTEGIHLQDALRIVRIASGLDIGKTDPPPDTGTLHGVLHFTGPAWLKTDGALTWGDVVDAGGFTLMCRIRSDMWVGQSHGIYVSLVSAADPTRSLIAIGHQYSPWVNAILENKTRDLVMTTADGSNMEYGVFYKLAVTQEAYEDILVTFQPPTATSDGHLKGYVRGALTETSNGGAPHPFDYLIPAGTDMGWETSDAFVLTMGKADDNRQGFRLSETALWKGVLPEADIAAIHYKYLAAQPDAPATHWDDLLLYYAPDADQWDPGHTLANLATGTSSRGILPLVSQSDSGVRFDVRTVPDYAGYPAVVVPQPIIVATAPTIAAPDESSIAVDVPDPGSSPYGVVDRTVYVTRGCDDYAAYPVAEHHLAPEETSVTVSGLTAGTDYEAVVEYLDTHSVTAVYRLPFRTAGTAPAIPPRQSMIAQGAFPKTRSDVGKIPLKVDGLTLSFWIKRSPLDLGHFDIISIDDCLNESKGLDSGYSVFQVTQFGGSITLTLGDGDRWGDLNWYLTTPFYLIPADDTWEHWAVGVDYPKQGKAGGVYLYRNGSLVAEDTNFPAVRSHNQDATHKKWEASFHPMNGEFGAYSAVSVSDMALFDVGPKAVLDGLPLYDLTGQFPAREMPPSARRHLIVAYDGANDGTQYIPSDGYVRDMIHGLHYVDGAAEEKSFDARVPIPPYGLSFSADLPVIPPASDPPPG